MPTIIRLLGGAIFVAVANLVHRLLIRLASRRLRRYLRIVENGKTVKGRGATCSPVPRYLETICQPVDDGWSSSDLGEIEDFPVPDPRTQFYPDKTKNIIATNRSPDVPFDQSINPYKGCEHGCVYCYARPTHAYLDLSPGLDFETQIFYKTDPIKRLREALDSPNYRCKPLAIGTNTDPYQPGERTYRVTRQLLETLLEYRHPVSVITKGSLILRDMDLLGELARLKLVSVAVSITTLDDELKAKLEPRTASPKTRLRIVREMAEAGVPVGVMMAPVIPYLNDGEIEAIVKQSKDAGAQFVNYVMIRLPLEVKVLFENWLNEHYPLKAGRIMSRIRDLHGGRTYKSEWGIRMRGQGPFAEIIANRFKIARRKYGIGTTKQRVDAMHKQRRESDNTDSSTSDPFTLRMDLFKKQPRQIQLF